MFRCFLCPFQQYKMCMQMFVHANPHQVNGNPDSILKLPVKGAIHDTKSAPRPKHIHVSLLHNGDKFLAETVTNISMNRNTTPKTVTIHSTMWVKE